MQSNNESYDDIEDKRREELLERVRQEFATVPYPDGYNLTKNPLFWEAAYLEIDFSQKSWISLPLDLLLTYRLVLPLFTPQAFNYYLPAYMMAALLYPIESDTIGEHIIYSLAPPEPNSLLISMEEFLERFEYFTEGQFSVIRQYVQLYVDIEKSYPDDIRDSAKKYWLLSS